MSNQTGAITMKGTPFTLTGSLPETGQPAPDFLNNIQAVNPTIQGEMRFISYNFRLHFSLHLSCTDIGRIGNYEGKSVCRQDGAQQVGLDKIDLFPDTMPLCIQAGHPQSSH